MDTEIHKQQWFAVQTKPRYERIAASILSEKEITCFLPTYGERRQWSDRTKTLDKPLFPGYFFYQEGVDSVTRVVATTGVIRIVGFANRPEPIEDSEIEAVRLAVRSGLGIRRHEYIGVGDRVRLRSGPLEGVEGILTGRNGEWRFIVSVGLLRRSVSVEVDAQWVEPLPLPKRAVAPHRPLDSRAVAYLKNRPPDYWNRLNRGRP